MNRELQDLIVALGAEAAGLECLLRLARVQQRAMVRGRVPLLEKVTRRIVAGIPRAEAAGRAREAAAAKALAAAGRAGVDPLALRSLLDGPDRATLDAALTRLSDAALGLRRQNFQNHQLARVSSDVVRGQIDLLTGQVVPGEPTYGPREEPVGAGRRGVMDGRA